VFLLLDADQLIFVLSLRRQDHLRQRLPEVPRAEKDEDAEVGVGHDRQVLLRLEQREREEAVRQEEEVVDLAEDPSGKSGVNFIKKFPSSLMTRPNKLECLSLETLSSQVLEFEGKARVGPIGAPLRCFLLG
jgi:hypothetical protein